jgi:hypothetical protein
VADRERGCVYRERDGEAFKFVRVSYSSMAQGSEPSVSVPDSEAPAAPDTHSVQECKNQTVYCGVCLGEISESCSTCGDCRKLVHTACGDLAHGNPDNWDEYSFQCYNCGCIDYDHVQPGADGVDVPQ